MQGNRASGFSGLSLVVFASFVAAGCLVPRLLAERDALRGQGAWLLAIAVLGGYANLAFTTATMYGDIVRVMVLFYLVLGCFMETLAMMITTIPIVAPIMFALGFDPVWLGIVIIILVECALITPPVGLNLFVVQSLRTSGSMNDVIAGAFPFVIMMLVMIALLAIAPDIALWVPRVFG